MDVHTECVEPLQDMVAREVPSYAFRISTGGHAQHALQEVCWSVPSTSLAGCSPLAEAIDTASGDSVKPSVNPETGWWQTSRSDSFPALELSHSDGSIPSTEAHTDAFISIRSLFGVLIMAQWKRI